MHNFEIIHFSWFGLDLQEPMALILNWLVTAFSLFAFWSLKRQSAGNLSYFSKFYLTLGISTFFGGLGHLFFQYTGFYGKFPSWITAVLAGYYAARGVLEVYGHRKGYQFLSVFLLIKSVVLICLSLISLKFVFVAIDAILTYLIYCGYLAWKLWKDEVNAMRFLVFGVAVLIPSAFIFLFNFNIHRYLNRDDLSHLLMLACIIFFYQGMKLLVQRENVQQA